MRSCDSSLSPVCHKDGPDPSLDKGTPSTFKSPLQLLASRPQRGLLLGIIIAAQPKQRQMPSIMCQSPVPENSTLPILGGTETQVRQEKGVCLADFGVEKMPMEGETRKENATRDENGKSMPRRRVGCPT